MGISDIAGKDIERVLEILFAVIEPSPGVEGVVVDKHFYVVALPHQGFSEVGADEPPGTGHEYVLHSCLQSFQVLIAITVQGG